MTSGQVIFLKFLLRLAERRALVRRANRYDD